MTLTHLANSLVTALALFSTTAALSQNLPEVPRDRTLISQGWDF